MSGILFFIFASCHPLINKFQIKERKKTYLPTMVSKIIFSLHYQIMGKEPVRVLTLFLSNGTKKHREPHRERGYHLNKSFFFVVFNHIIMLNFSDKIHGKGTCEGVDTIFYTMEPKTLGTT